MSQKPSLDTPELWMPPSSGYSRVLDAPEFGGNRAENLAWQDGAHDLRRGPKDPE